MVSLAEGVGARTPADVRSVARYPIVIQRLDGFMALHECAFSAVRAALPTEALHPLRLPDGRAILALSLFQKRAATAGHGAETQVLPPYAELSIGVIVGPPQVSWATLARAFAGMRQKDVGSFQLHMPLTDRTWRDGGRASMGLPMFVADFDLDLDRTEWRLRVSEQGTEILALAVMPGGLLTSRRDTQPIYGAMDGTLWAAPSRMSLVTQTSPRGATVSLGTGHPVAEDLRRLDVSPRALATSVIRSGRAIIGEPVPVGIAGESTCHPGLTIPLGRWAVRYPGTKPIDQHARPDWGTEGEDRAQR